MWTDRFLRHGVSTWAPLSRSSALGLSRMFLACDADSGVRQLLSAFELVENYVPRVVDKSIDRGPDCTCGACQRVHASFFRKYS